MRPNILLITFHDIGRHLRCYGVPGVHTPHMDSLAAGGVRFENAFCTAPQCSPSRASIATGRYPQANGVMGLTHADFGWDLHEEEVHLAQLLRDAGYHTALGSFQHETRRPLDRFGFIEQPGAHGPCGKIAETMTHWLRGRRGQSRPFYLQLAFFEPHRTMDGFGHPPDREHGVSIPPYLVDEPSAHEDFALFQGAIRAVDAAIGRIVQTLEETGLADDTILLLAADHGIPFPRAKCSLYDAGLEVALIMHWPRGKWAMNGRPAKPMIPNIDYAPTLLDLAGLPIPARMHGRSFAPLLRGEAYEPRDRVFGQMTYHDYCDPRRCVRTQTHKLILNFTTAPSFMDPSQGWRPKTITRHPPNPAYSYHTPVELYDLKNDPLETQNLAGDGAHAAVRAQLTASLRGWMESMNDPLLTGIPNSPAHHAAMRALRS